MNRYVRSKEIIGEAGFVVQNYEDFAAGHPSTWPDEKEQMARWLEGLDVPVGLMTCADDRSEHVVEACKLAGIRIPEDVAVIGVDNDELICELSNPRLSSIGYNIEQAGYEAAALLSRMIKGEAVNGGNIIAPVNQVFVRESTDIIAVNDSAVADALRFIRDHANQLINVSDVVHNSAFSRRGLEKRFHEALGRTIYGEICRFRAERIAQILVETDYAVSEIALDLGYASEDHIARFFRHEFGQTPLAYRKKHQYRD